MVYHCARCGYVTERKCDIHKHIFKRKDLCPSHKSDISKSEMIFIYDKDVKKENDNNVNEQNEYVCYFCPNAFCTRTGRLHHIKKSHPNEYQDIKSEPSQAPNIENTNTTTIDGDHNTVNNTINNPVTNNITNIHIHLNPFGQENKEYLTDEQRQHCLSGGYAGLQKLLFDIFFNEKHPENHNIKLKSIKNQHVNLYMHDTNLESNVWKAKHVDDALTTMVQASQAEIQKVGVTADYDKIIKMHEIYNPTPSQRSNTKKKVLAELVDRRNQEKLEANKTQQASAE